MPLCQKFIWCENSESSVATSPYYPNERHFHSNKKNLQILVIVINLHQSMTIAHIWPNIIPHPQKKKKKASWQLQMTWYNQNRLNEERMTCSVNAIFSTVQGIFLFDFVYKQVPEPPNTSGAALQHRHTLVNTLSTLDNLDVNTRHHPWRQCDFYFSLW